MQLSSSANHFAPSWIGPMKLCFLRDNLKHSPAENNGKQDENKMETNISLDTALLHVSCFFIWHDPVCWFLPLICRFDGIPNLHNPCCGCQWKRGRDEHKGNDHKDVLRQTVRTTTKRHAWNRKFYGKNLNLNQNL